MLFYGQSDNSRLSWDPDKVYQVHLNLTRSQLNCCILCHCIDHKEFSFFVFPWAAPFLLLKSSMCTQLCMHHTSRKNKIIFKSFLPAKICNYILFSLVRFNGYTVWWKAWLVFDICVFDLNKRAILALNAVKSGILSSKNKTVISEKYSKRHLFLPNFCTASALRWQFRDCSKL